MERPPPINLHSAATWYASRTRTPSRERYQGTAAENTRFQERDDPGERDPKRSRLNSVMPSLPPRSNGPPRYDSPRSRTISTPSMPRTKPLKKNTPIYLRPGYGVLTKEEEAERQQWRIKMGRIPGILHAEPLNLELDPNYHNWTEEEKEADRQRWRLANGRIPGSATQKVTDQENPRHQEKSKSRLPDSRSASRERSDALYHKKAVKADKDRHAIALPSRPQHQKEIKDEVDPDKQETAREPFSKPHSKRVDGIETVGSSAKQHLPRPTMKREHGDQDTTWQNISKT